MASDPVGCKGVARGQLAGLIAGCEPALTLRTCAVRERVRLGNAAGHALQTVVTNLPRGIHRLLDVSGVEAAEPGVGVARPDAGKAVGLKLDADRNRVGLGGSHLSAELVGLWQNAQFILHMVRNLM